MKTLYTAADIETLAHSGQRTLLLGPDDILTPLARDRARELGFGVHVNASVASASAPQRRLTKPLTAGLRADAQLALCELLRQAREETVDVSHLAQCFNNLLRAVEEGDSLSLPRRPRVAGLSPERTRALAGRVGKMAALGQFLFGPESSHRRFDILWALTALKTLLDN